MSVTDAPSGPRYAASRRAPNLTGHLARRKWAGGPVARWSKVGGALATKRGPWYRSTEAPSGRPRDGRESPAPTGAIGRSAAPFDSPLVTRPAGRTKVPDNALDARSAWL